MVQLATKAGSGEGHHPFERRSGTVSYRLPPRSFLKLANPDDGIGAEPALGRVRPSRPLSQELSYAGGTPGTGGWSYGGGRLPESDQVVPGINGGPRPYETRVA